MCTENVQPPLLAGQPGYDPGLDRGKVCVDQHVPRTRNECRPNQLAQCVGHTAVYDLQCIGLVLLYKLPGQLDRVCVRPGEVLDLHKAASPPPCPVGPVELQEPAHAAVGTDTGLYSVVLLCAGLAEILPDLKGPPDLRRKICL